MPYVPRPATTAKCAHCNASFEKRHASRKYCSNSCNVQASYARTGYRGEAKATRADLEQMLTEMRQLMRGQLAPVPPKPTAKGAVTPTKKITKPAPHKPTANAAATPGKKKASTKNVAATGTPSPTKTSSHDKEGRLIQRITADW